MWEANLKAVLDDLPSIINSVEHILSIIDAKHPAVASLDSAACYLHGAHVDLTIAQCLSVPAPSAPEGGSTTSPAIAESAPAAKASAAAAAKQEPDDGEY